MYFCDKILLLHYRTEKTKIVLSQVVKVFVGWEVWDLYLVLLQIEEINEGEDTCFLLPVAIWPKKVSHRISSGKRPNCVCVGL